MNKAAKTVSYNRMNGKDRKKQILRVSQHILAEDNYYCATQKVTTLEIEKGELRAWA